MIPISAPSRSRPAASAELHRLAEALARAEGWRPQGPPIDDPGGGVCVAVEGEGVPGPSLLRVRPPRGNSDADELCARREAASEHVVGIVSELGVRRVRGREVEAVVLSHPPGGTLADLLLRRSSSGVSGGEAATILLAAADGAAALHASGWAHPTLSASGVQFAADGCPALGLFDDVRLLDPEGAVDDAEAFHAFARTLCLRVADGTGMRLLAAVEGALRTGRWSAVAPAVAAVAPPEPVRLEGSPAAAPEAVAAMVGASRSGKGRTARGLGARLLSAVDVLDGEPVRALAARFRAMLRRRPLLVAVAAIPVAAALAFVALAPGGPTGETVPGAAGPGSSASHLTAPSNRADSLAGGSPDAAAAAPGMGGASDTRSGPALAASSPAPDAGGSGASATAATGGTAEGESAGSSRATPTRGGTLPSDPVDAAHVLLEARHTCFAATRPSAGCLSGVLDEAAGLAAAEASALGTADASEARDYAGAGLSLVERWGDAALVAAAPDSSRTPKSRPASLLLVRSEAGWRLRAVFP